MKLAVISCKARKQKYECSAEEMYMPSQFHRAQIAFIKKYYDAYIILSSKYGVLFPAQIIEPYSIVLYINTKAKTRGVKKVYIMTREETVEWGKQVMTHPIFTQYDHIDFHLTSTYWNSIKNIVPDICKSWFRVSFPQSIFTAAKRYEKLLEDFEDGKPIDLSVIGKKIISKFPERKRWFYHYEYEPFFGYGRVLVEKYPEQKLDEIALWRIDRISIKGERHHLATLHHKGWCCKEETLEHLYKNEKGMWRYRNKV